MPITMMSSHHVRLLLVLLVLTSPRTLSQSLENSCCRLDLSAQDVPTRIQFVLTNLHSEPVRTARWVAESYNVQIQVSRSDGSEPERTDVGKGVLRPKQGSRIVDVILKKGEKITTVLDVRDQFILKTGTYTVKASREVFIGEKKIEVQGQTTIRVP